MINYEKIWSEISRDPAPALAVVRRVLPELSHDLHLGEERPKKVRFLRMHLVGAIGDVPHGTPSTKGVEVKVILETKTKATIQVTETAPRSEQFEELVENLIDLLTTDPGDGAAARVLERLLAWQAFFARKTALSTDEAAGLFGELLVLTELMAPTLGAPAAVQYWTGPDRKLQDFQLPNVAVEVKTWRGAAAGELKISSERQLDSTGLAHLIIAWVHLDERLDGTGETLADRVQAARDAVAASASASAELETKLLKARWRDDLAEVRTERYSVLVQEHFRVEDGFPRLTPSSLSTGIGSVSYRIDRGAIDPFFIDQELVVSLLEAK
ncbi:PD-(D/E)XK motif protein [Nocardioides sp. Root151]|uniref:PD-(D/E)XK motif protein n=1 Tax=Nocardioides sp. Root151 TaxID=1736475 RepID=UPI0007025E3E|nr:PD-(D/E)XK motif protein [Nocardioides sp. Root151]KQZ67106.1 hypothetical protein ASD66_19130 [Nocardioides sp. Root151]